MECLAIFPQEAEWIFSALNLFPYPMCLSVLMWITNPDLMIGKATDDPLVLAAAFPDCSGQPVPCARLAQHRASGCSLAVEGHEDS